MASIEDIVGIQLEIMHNGLNELDNESYYYDLIIDVINKSYFSIEIINKKAYYILSCETFDSGTAKLKLDSENKNLTTSPEDLLLLQEELDKLKKVFINYSELVHSDSFYEQNPNGDYRTGSYTENQYLKKLQDD